MPISGLAPYMRHVFEVPFAGHPNVRSTHRTTTEITVEPSLTPRGDCIVGVGAGAGCAGLPADVKGAIRRAGSRVRVTVAVGQNRFVIRGRGDPGLSLEHPTDMVVRKSGFLCPRTLAVGCDAASVDMPREMVRDLRRGAGGVLVIEVDAP